ncbi:MAG TPA: hypothetical protein VK846_00810 [Candidatus Limnocylindria bacterium]|nr:hypothetical protein [Candidatus Limnocylindria bacterium]
MQKVLFTLAFLASAAAAVAQVNVELVFDQEQFLRSESLPVRVRISNFSGQPLRLGEEPDWLAFTIDREEGKALAKSGAIPMPKPFTIESAKTISLRLDLMPYFELNEAGRYKLTARVKVPQLEKELTTLPKHFDIVSGSKLWEKDVGVPGTTPPVARKFALQQATFLKQARLYVRLTDVTEANVVRVLPLGTLTSFSMPEAAVDSVSQLHVIFQNSQRGFLYSVVTPDGEQIIRQAFDMSGDRRPRLRAEPDGRLIVHGGQRRISLSDLPPPRVAETNDTTQSK